MKSFLLRGLVPIFLFALANIVYAQNAVGIGTETPNPRAVLELISPTNDQGFLVPKLTTAQRTAVAFTSSLTAAENGLLVFDADENQFYFWNSGAWQPVSQTVAIGLGLEIDSLGQIASTGDLDSTNELQTADEIPLLPSGNLTSTDVQNAFLELQGDLDILGTAASLDAGTGPNEVLQLDASGALPAVDGSQLTGVSPVIAVGSIGSGEITDGSITNTDIDNAAAIDGTKVNPDFGSQNVQTTGTVTATSFTGDGSGLTNVTPSFNSPFTDDATNVVFGSTSIVPAPGGQTLQVIDDNVGGGSLIAAGTYSVDPSLNRTGIILLSGRGTQTSPEAIQQDDLLGEIVFNGYYGTGIMDIDNSATIESVASENWTSGANGGELIFATTANGTAGSTERMRILQSGDITMTNNLTVSGTISGDGSGLSGVTATPSVSSVGTNEIIDGAITDVDINIGANIMASKLESTVMTEGEDISLLNNDEGYLTDTAVPNPAGDISGTFLAGFQVQAGALNEFDMAASIAGAGLVGSNGAPIDVNTDGVTLQTVADVLEVRDNGILNAKIASGAVTLDKIASGTQYSLFATDISGDAIHYQPGPDQVVTTNGSGQIISEARTNFTDDQNASEVSYNNAIVGFLSGSDIQSAMDEVASDLNDVGMPGGNIITDNTTVLNALTELEGATESVQASSSTTDGIANDLVSLSGLPANTTDLGMFTGNIISDFTDVKNALEELEGATESVQTSLTTTDGIANDLVSLSGLPANTTDLGTFGGNIITDNTGVKNALSELEGATESVQTSLTTTDGIANDLVSLSGLPANSTDLGTFGGNIITDNTGVKNALSELEAATETATFNTNLEVPRGNGTGLTSSNIYSDGTNVGIGTASPQSPLQIGNNLGIFHFDDGASIVGEVVADNLHPNGTILEYTNTDFASFIFLNDGNVEFLTGTSQTAGTDALAAMSVSNLLKLDSIGNAYFKGSVQVSDFKGIGSPEDGMIRLDEGGANTLQGYQSGQWLDLIGLNFPVSESINDGTSSPFFIDNIGLGGVAKFEVSNTSSDQSALIGETDGNAGGARAVHGIHTGTGGPAGEFQIIQPSSTQSALVSNTSGTGSAASFQITNSGSGAAAVSVNNNGTGQAIYTNKTNNGTGIQMDHSGSSGSALFLNSSGGANTSPVLQIDNTTSGPDLRLNGTNPIQITDSPGTDYVLTSDASGNGTWQPLPAAAVTLDGNSSLVGGSGASSVGTDNVSLGTSANSSGSDAVTIGNTSITNTNSVAIGTLASANNIAGVAVGHQSTGLWNSVAIGRGANAIGDTATAVGAGAAAQGYQSLALGNAAFINASGTSGIAIGFQSSTTADKAISIGANAQSSADSAVAIGAGTVANIGRTIVLGNGDYKVGIGTSAPNSTFEIGSLFNFFDLGGDKAIAKNVDGAGNYINSAPASTIVLQDEAIGFFAIPSGTAGTPFTLNTRMNLKNDGLVINGDSPALGTSLDVRASGTTTPDVIITDDGNDVNSDASLQFTSTNAGTQNFVQGVDADDGFNFKIAEGTTLGTTDRVVIEAGTGNVGIGITPGEALDVVGNVQVDGASEFKYASAKTRYASFPAAAFAHAKSQGGQDYDLVTLNATTYYRNFYGNTGAPTALAYADVQVNLPDGAIVDELTGYLYNNDTVAFTVRARMHRIEHTTGNNAIMGTAETSTQNGTIQTIVQNSISNATIDNSLYSYIIRFTGRSHSDLTRLYAVRVRYTVTQAD